MKGGVTMLLESLNPFFDVAKTLEEFDRMFGAVGHPIGLRSVPRGTFPPINIYNKDDAVILIAEVPGLNADDIDLTVLGDSVTLKCERKPETDESIRYHRKERATGGFSRTVTLPDPVDPEAIKATYENGVLRVEMHKAQDAKSKKILIKS
ncbi:MAG: Hsp20/alpha crystallin family protein [Planctomycetota bacterium]|nr:MAG: Hsp20/alpha crystallin family protein [Planctomycetota bacterium]